MRRLDERARTTETAALLFAEVEVSSTPLPDVGIALWLKGRAVDLNPDRPVVIENLLYNLICDDLGGSPLVAARAMDTLRQELRGVLEMDASVEDPLEAIPEAEGSLLAKLRSIETNQLLESLSSLRLSELAIAVAAEAKAGLGAPSHAPARTSVGAQGRPEIRSVPTEFED